MGGADLAEDRRSISLAARCHDGQKSILRSVRCRLRIAYIEFSRRSPSRRRQQPTKKTRPALEQKIQKGTAGLKWPLPRTGRTSVVVGRRPVPRPRLWLSCRCRGVIRPFRPLALCAACRVKIYCFIRFQPSELFAMANNPVIPVTSFILGGRLG